MVADVDAATVTTDAGPAAVPTPERSLRSLVPAGHVVLSTLRCMEIAEEEIQAAKERHPEAALRLHAAFRLLLPSPVLREKAERLYRHHAHELLDRVAKGQDARPGTVAEAVAALSEMALRTPLASAATSLYEHLFEQVFGFSVGDAPPREPHVNAWADLLGSLRQRLAVAERVPQAARPPGGAA